MATNANPITITLLTDAEVGYCAKATIKVPGLGTAVVRGKWRPTREQAMTSLRAPLSRKLATFLRQAQRLEDRAHALRNIATQPHGVEAATTPDAGPAADPATNIN